jgi:hypothetical protein
MAPNLICFNKVHLLLRLIHSSWHYMGLQSRNNQGESNAYPNSVIIGISTFST